MDKQKKKKEVFHGTMDVHVCVYTEQTPFKSAHTLSSNSTAVKKTYTIPYVSE